MKLIPKIFLALGVVVVSGCNPSSNPTATEGSSPAASVATPTFTPPEGAYPASDYPKTVTVATVTANCHMRYTLDGSTPTNETGMLIPASSGTVSVSSGQTLKAIAFQYGVPFSAVASGTYSTSVK